MRGKCTGETEGVDVLKGVRKGELKLAESVGVLALRDVIENF